LETFCQHAGRTAGGGGTSKFGIIDKSLHNAFKHHHRIQVPSKPPSSPMMYPIQLDINLTVKNFDAIFHSSELLSFPREVELRDDQMPC
jgi:hypothetical protein